MHPLVQQAVESKDMTGSFGTSLLMPAYRSFAAKRLLIVGLGKPQELTIERVRKAAATVIVKAKELKLKALTLVMPDVSLDDLPLVTAMAEGAILSDYAYSKHTDQQHEKQQHVQTVHIAVGERDAKQLQTLVSRTTSICEGVRLVRDLVNEGSDLVNTLHIEKICGEIAAKHGLAITVLDEKDVVEEGLNLLHAVGRSGSTPPRLIILEYKGNPGSGERVALVGKTITFDTGGVNLKPTGHVETMHQDMAGGATVLGVLDVACTLKIPVNIIAVVAAAENGLGPGAYKPGEIFTSYAGKTVEVKSTDAEGRLVLADAIAYTIKHHAPTALVDVATLTGAALVALGTHVIPVIGNNTILSSKLFDAGQRTYERIWLMPLYDEYKDEIKSDVADMKNLGDQRNAGTIAGAAFINAFVGTTPWAHLDIAGVAFLEKGRGYTPQGATGSGVRLLIDLLSHWENGLTAEETKG